MNPREVQSLIKAIEGNTRELKRFRESFEKVNKVPKPVTLTQIFSGGDHDGDTAVTDGPNGPIEPR